MSKITRRGLFGLGAGALCYPLLPSQGMAAQRQLPLLPLRDLTIERDDRVSLSIRQGRHDFGNGASSATYGIDNSFMGPVLRVRNGQTIPFTVKNRLEHQTTLHWHGMHVPGEVDGGPHQIIPPGGEWLPDVPVRQRASFNWFHSHDHGQTAPQVYKGIAGAMIVEDDDSMAADLPRTYGVDDFVLVIQDKSFDESGRLTYALNEWDRQDGFFGESFVVNGALAGMTGRVPAGWIRLRLLNGANARQFGIACGDGTPLLVIGSDGGFLNKSIETGAIALMPGERYEVLVDCSQKHKLELVALLSADEDDDISVQLVRGARSLRTHPLVSFAVDSSMPAFTARRPELLANLEPVAIPRSVRIREFMMNMEVRGQGHMGNMHGMESMMGINGRAMDMDVINERVSRGETELWRLTSEWNLHPFHVHGCSFRILSQDGRAPLDYQQGWKDMVMIDGRGISEILVRFDHPANDDAPYMYHCHILEHEDMGMMGQFTVA